MNKTFSSEWCIAPEAGVYEIISSFHGVLNPEVGCTKDWDGQILANVLVNSDDKIIPTVQGTMYISNVLCDDGHSVSVCADYRTHVRLDRGDEVWVDYVTADGAIEFVDAPLEIICGDTALTPLTQRVEALMEDEIELYDVGGGEITLNVEEGTHLKLLEVDPAEQNMLRFFGQDEDGNNIETVAINCATGAVTINADNKNIEEDAKDFWRAVATGFPGLFEKEPLEYFSKGFVEHYLNKSVSAAERYDRAMGVFKDNG